MKSEKRCLTENQQWFLMPRVLAIKRLFVMAQKEAIAAIQAYYEQQRCEQWLSITVNYRQSYVVLMQE